MYRKVKVIDRLLCYRCDLSFVGVEFTAHGKEPAFYCWRLDCDNWLTPGFQENLEVIADDDDTI